MFFIATTRIWNININNFNAYAYLLCYGWNRIANKRVILIESGVDIIPAVISSFLTLLSDKRKTFAVFLILLLF